MAVRNLATLIIHAHSQGLAVRSAGLQTKCFMSITMFPSATWQRAHVVEAGFDPGMLDVARQWLDSQPDGQRYRVVIVCDGMIAAEWNREVGRDDRLPLASAAKSVLSCMLGIAIAEGRIASADDKIADYYPEALDVPQGEGPKPGRHAFPKDRGITLRQLISNTSGDMKPGEEPGRVFHYQTYGMNILGHAIATCYGFYDCGDPEGSPNLAVLYDQKIGHPIRARWRYASRNFDLPTQARIHIFGYRTGIESPALDMARLGWLWCNGGRWKDRQIVPAAWLREATQTAPDILAHCPSEQWLYGHGFWTNDRGRLWPALPRDAFSAAGAGSQLIWVSPGRRWVIVQSPGLPV